MDVNVVSDPSCEVLICWLGRGFTAWKVGERG